MCRQLGPVLRCSLPPWGINEGFLEEVIHEPRHRNATTLCFVKEHRDDRSRDDRHVVLCHQEYMTRKRELLRVDQSVFHQMEKEIIHGNSFLHPLLRNRDSPRVGSGNSSAGTAFLHATQDEAARIIRTHQEVIGLPLRKSRNRPLLNASCEF